MKNSLLIEKLALILVAVATLISLLVAKVGFALGVAVGGLLAVANFYALRRLMLGIVGNKASPPRQAFLTVLLLAKFGLLGAILYAIIVYLPVDAIGMLLGVSLVVASIFIEGLRTMMRRAPAEEAEEAD